MNVITVHGVGTFRDEVYLTMEYMEAGTLRTWLRERLRSVDDILDKFIQAGTGLAAAHRAQIVHRDFKPANVLLDSDGRVVVSDFGLVGASTYESSESTTPGAAFDFLQTITRTGTLVGTPAYMAPEQLVGRPVDQRADQYAFAVSLYEALYGTRPFAGSTISELIRHAATGEREIRVPARPDVPEHVRRALAKALQRRPEQRFATMTDMVEALRPPKASASGRSWRFVVVGAMVVLLGMIVALGVGGLRSESPVASPVVKPDDQGQRYATVTLRSVPSVAQVYRAADNTWLGQTPFSAQFPTTQGVAEFVVRKPGFETAKVSIPTTGDELKLVELSPVSNRASPGAATKPMVSSTTTKPKSTPRVKPRVVRRVKAATAKRRRSPAKVDRSPQPTPRPANIKRGDIVEPPWGTK